MTPSWRPPYAYVPGQTPRHDPAIFERFHAPDPEALKTSENVRIAPALYQDGFFWETHEVLEPVWMALPDGTPDRAMVQAVIQLANARLKLQMDRPNAALRLVSIVEDLLAHSTDSDWFDADWITREIAAIRAA